MHATTNNTVQLRVQSTRTEFSNRDAIHCTKNAHCYGGWECQFLVYGSGSFLVSKLFCGSDREIPKSVSGSVSHYSASFQSPNYYTVLVANSVPGSDIQSFYCSSSEIPHSDSDSGYLIRSADVALADVDVDRMHVACMALPGSMVLYWYCDSISNPKGKAVKPRSYQDQQ